MTDPVIRSRIRRVSSAVTGTEIDMDENGKLKRSDFNQRACCRTYEANHLHLSCVVSLSHLAQCTCISNVNGSPADVSLSCRSLHGFMIVIIFVEETRLDRTSQNDEKAATCALCGSRLPCNVTCAAAAPSISEQASAQHPYRPIGMDQKWHRRSR